MLQGLLTLLQLHPLTKEEVASLKELSMDKLANTALMNRFVCVCVVLCVFFLVLVCVFELVGCWFVLGFFACELVCVFFVVYCVFMCLCVFFYCVV